MRKKRHSDQVRRFVDPHARRTGCSMIETMTALTILGLFMAVTCRALLASHQMLDLSRDNYIASNLAKDRLELIRTFAFDQIPNLAEEAIIIDNSGVAAERGHFRRTTKVTMLDTNLFEVVIDVDIQNRRTLQYAPAKQSISTYIADHL